MRHELLLVAKTGISRSTVGLMRRNPMLSLRRVLRKSSVRSIRQSGRSGTARDGVKRTEKTEMTKRTIRTEMTGSAVLLACESLFCLFCRFGLLPESDGFVTIYRERGDGSINGSINEGGGTINGKINGSESGRKDCDSSGSSQIADFILPRDTEDGKINGTINGTINNGSGSINGSIKYEYVDGLTRNEEKILSIVRSNPGCKRDEFKSQMSCSERTIIRCVANLIAGNMLEYRGSKKTGGYYLIEKA